MAVRALTEDQQNWVTWGTNALAEDLESYENYEDYYDGEHELAFATERWEEEFGELFEEFADNWCGVVVDAPTQRLKILGWDSTDKAVAREAQDLWEDPEKGFQAEFDDIFTQAFVKGDSYAMVWEVDGDPDDAELFFNDATEVQVQYDPKNRRRIIRAVKRWEDEEGNIYMGIYFPEKTDIFYLPSRYNASEVAARGVPIPTNLSVGWELAETVINPYRMVPVFHFKNRASGRPKGISEIKGVIPMQNAVNKLLMDLMLGSEFGSYRQKWMAGGGHPKDGWQTGPNRLWATTDPGAKFGEFSQTDLEPVTRAVEMVVGHIAKTTQTPLHYLRSSGDMPSGEALKTAESGLTHKCENRQERWHVPASQTMKLMLKIRGMEQVDNPDFRITPVWDDPTTRHDLEQAQTAQLKALLGIPLDQLWSEHFGYSEDQIDEFKKLNVSNFTAALQAVLAQTGQLPPGVEQALAESGSGGPVALPQLLALLPKSVTAKTPAGEATTSPQANTRPPGSPTRRSTGFRD